MPTHMVLGIETRTPASGWIFIPAGASTTKCGLFFVAGSGLEVRRALIYARKQVFRACRATTWIHDRASTRPLRTWLTEADYLSQLGAGPSVLRRDWLGP